MVGLSQNTARPAWGVSRTLEAELGKTVIAVNPRGEASGTAPGYSSLADIPQPVDVVDVFVNTVNAEAVVDAAVAIGASAVWLQLGVEPLAAVQRAIAAGIAVVMDRCPVIEARRMGLL